MGRYLIDLNFRTDRIYQFLAPACTARSQLRIDDVQEQLMRRAIKKGTKLLISMFDHFLATKNIEHSTTTMMVSSSQYVTRCAIYVDKLCYSCLTLYLHVEYDSHCTLRIGSYFKVYPIHATLRGRILQWIKFDL
jgi:hypothetical protein